MFISISWTGIKAVIRQSWSSTISSWAGLAPSSADTFTNIDNENSIDLNLAYPRSTLLGWRAFTNTTTDSNNSHSSLKGQRSCSPRRLWLTLMSAVGISRGYESSGGRTWPNYKATQVRMQWSRYWWDHHYHKTKQRYDVSLKSTSTCCNYQMLANKE